MIGDSTSNYRLTVQTYRGNAGDSLASGHRYKIHNGMQFSTRRRDNDKYKFNCAYNAKGGWWFYACFVGYLNGLYGRGGLRWSTWRGETLKISEMKIRHEQL